MCGLAGILTTREGTVEDLQAVIHEMSECLEHRGPDDAGVHVDEDAGLAFGFRRLSIIDLSPTGHQPMVSESGRYVVMLNGEVYNFLSLRQELESGGAEFRGDSDTEVVANAFDRWGVRGALERFVGMFAIAVWDRRERRLLLARDRLGIKPLFIYSHDGTLAFASELKSLHAVPGFDRTLDRTAIVSYLRHLYIPAPRSIFTNVQKLAPGHVVEIRTPAEEPVPEPYWSLEDVARQGLADPFRGSRAEAVDEVDALLGEAVRIRLRSDVPLGALLSGGIDSTAVVALAQEATSTPIRTFTIAFDRTEHDESEHAAAVASHLGTDHTELRLTGESSLDVIPELPTIFDEPLADPSQIPTYCVSRLARKEVTVALSGDGGDEIFGGYNRYLYGEKAIRKALSAPRSVRRAAAAAAGAMSADRWGQLHRTLSGILPASLQHRLPGQKAKKLARMAREDSAGAMYRSLVSAFHEPERFVRGGSDPTETHLDQALGRLGTDRLLDGMQYLDQKSYLPDDLLAKVDRASMAVSLEARVPILDHRVVEFAWRLPPRHRIGEGTGKVPLREIVCRRVPRDLVDRPKVGFSVPLEDWLAGPLRDWAGDLLSSTRPGGDDVLVSETVRSAWDGFDRGETELAPGIWALLMLQAWREEWCG